jgi:hypothetical protein
MRKRSRESIVQETLFEAARKIVWALIMFLGYLSYYGGARPYFLEKNGAYVAGLLDGSIIAVSIKWLSFYIISISIYSHVGKKKR